MKTLLLPLLLLFAFNAFAQTDADALLQKTNRNFFIENKGQWNPKVKFLAKIGGMNAWITQNGVVYDYYKIEKDYDEKTMRDMPEHEKEIYENEHTIIKGHVVRTTFANNNEAKEFEGENKEEAYYNYFIGNDESKWASYVPLYEGATVKDLYEGIDVKYYFDKGLLRYDFIVHPGADIEKISIELEGADGYKVNEKGELVVETSLGKVTHSDILAYQKRGGGTKEVAALFTKKENGKISFEIGSYDKDKKLIIDPLIYSTYLGGSNSEVGESIGLDSEGNAYVAGHTLSTNYPTTYGAYQTTSGGNTDAFVTKINTDGSALVYSTYLGGSSSDEGFCITIDGGGNAYVTGYTTSTNFPVTSGAVQTTDSGSADAFVTKLNTDGSALVYSTYLGGNNNDEGHDIILDDSGNAYVTGRTESTNFPVTSGAFQTTYGGSGDAFVTKLNTDGSALVYSTYLGGSDGDIGNGITLDGGGNAFVTGETGSTDFPVTSGAFQTTFGGGYDTFVTKLNTDGSALVYSTYLGGNNLDSGYAITHDGGGNAFVTGYTYSTDFPITSGAFQTTFGGGYSDAFVTKLNTDGSALVYSTYLGGSSADLGFGITLDGGNKAFVTGYTKGNFPVTSGAFQETYGGGYNDAFITKLNPDGSALVYSTYLGGSSDDLGFGITLDDGGNAFIVGETRSTNFPVTSGAYQETYGGGYYDAFVAKIEIPDISFQLKTPAGGEVWEGNTFHNITWTEDYILTDIKIELSTDNGSSWITLNEIAQGVLNYTWEVLPMDIAQARIRIYPVGFESNAQISNPFQITTSTADRITLTSQNGEGIKYNTGSIQDITWEKVGSASAIDIEYTTDAGNNWTLIASNVDASLFTYSWTVPNAPSELCKIRIVDSALPTVYDYGDAFFAIKSVNLTSFNEFSFHRGGTVREITWNSTGVDNVKLYYSSDNGTSWHYITQTAATDYSYNWTLPQIESAQCLVKIEDASDNTLFDISDEAFEIWLPISVTMTPVVGDNSICFSDGADETFLCLDLFVVTAADITCVFYPYETPAYSSLPDGIDHVAKYFWAVSASGISFLNGIVSANIADLEGITQPDKLHWLKRSASGDPWTDIGGEVVDGMLKSTVQFDSFSEFTIASTDASNPLPVELAAFAAEQNEDKIILRWETATETNNKGFQVERASSRLVGTSPRQDEWKEIGFVEGNGTTTERQNYVFIDENLYGGGKVKYRLKQIDNDGSVQYSEEIEVETSLPKEFKLSQNYPNPFSKGSGGNPATIIKYSVPEESIVRLEIFNILGERVAQLVSGKVEAGYRKLSWNASNLPSGVYIISMRAEGITTRRSYAKAVKAVLVK